MSSIDHALYRFYGHAGQLLYIGITRDPSSRWAQHSSDKQWWHEVQRIAIQAFPDRASARKAERAAIKSEKPHYNITHNQAKKPRPVLAGKKGEQADLRWRMAAADWLTLTGQELPRCECSLPRPEHCGEYICVAAMAAFAEGATRGLDEARRYIGLKSGYNAFLSTAGS